MKKDEPHPVFKGIGVQDYFEQRKDLINHDISTKNQPNLATNEQLILAKMRQKISFPQPLLLVNDIGIIYPNTITLIQGKSGVHKSRLSSHMMSVLLSDLPTEIAGLNRNGREPFNVISIDTERSINDLLPYAMQSVIVDAGYSKNETPPHFRTTSLVNIERKNRLEGVKAFIADAIEKTTFHNVIFLDVISDLIEDFNNVPSSLQLLDYLNSMINEFNITIVAVIHENPGSTDKSRGHLGTELHNKASSVIQISGEKDQNNKSINIQKVTVLKSRYTAPFEPTYYSYNETTKQLEQQDKEFALAYTEKKKDSKVSSEGIFEFFKSVKPHEKILKQKLAKSLCAKFQCSDKLLSQRLNEIEESGKFFGYILKSEMEGRHKVYWMESQLALMEEGNKPI